MKKNYLCWVLIPLAIIIWAITIIPGTALAEEAADEKIASVNGTVITQGEFEREMMTAYRQFMSSGRTINQSQLPEFKKQVLESLIGQELIFQESLKKGIKVEDKAIDAKVDKMKQGFADEEAFKAALEKSKISEDKLRSDLRKKMCVQTYIDQEFTKSTMVPENEIKSFYDSHPEAFKKPEQIRARHILIKVDQTADKEVKEKAREKIIKIQERIKKGEDFAELAKEVSEDGSAEKGGDLGYFGRGAMVPPFEEAAFALAKDEVSDIVETQFGYHLIKVEDKNPESTIKYDEVKDRLQDYLTQLKIREKVKTRLGQLTEKAKIERFME